LTPSLTEAAVGVVEQDGRNIRLALQHGRRVYSGGAFAAPAILCIHDRRAQGSHAVRRHPQRH
jgi:hypothetical protein